MAVEVDPLSGVQLCAHLSPDSRGSRLARKVDLESSSSSQLTIAESLGYCLSRSHFLGPYQMARSPIFEADRPLFSGHETFPVRYGWLKKAYDAVAVSKGDSANKSIFASDDAIAEFGVGKNMVGSIRHWATSCGVIAEEISSGQLKTTRLGDFLFGPRGVDPYLENPSSLWLLHWHLCCGEPSKGLKTTWYWVFNHFTGVTFVREDLVEGLMKLASSLGWPRVSKTTVQRDVECFVRTYATRPTGIAGAAEDSLESALAELGLIRGLRGHYQLVRGAKRTLPMEVFVYALNSFWTRYSTTNTLSFEAIVHEPGSPGRVFLLDEGDLADRLSEIGGLTNGVFEWSETAGLKQVLRTRTMDESEAVDLLRGTYESQPLGTR